MSKRMFHYGRFEKWFLFGELSEGLRVAPTFVEIRISILKHPILWLEKRRWVSGDNHLLFCHYD